MSGNSWICWRPQGDSVQYFLTIWLVNLDPATLLLHREIQITPMSVQLRFIDRVDDFRMKHVQLQRWNQRYGLFARLLFCLRIFCLRILRKGIKHGGIAGIAINPRVVHVAELPMDHAGGGLLAQPLATPVAMGFSYRIGFLHMNTLRSSPRWQLQSQCVTGLPDNHTAEMWTTGKRKKVQE